VAFVFENLVLTLPTGISTTAAVPTAAATKPAATSSAISTAATTTTAVSTATAAPLLAGTRLVHIQRPAIHVTTIHRLHGIRRFVRIRHFHEGEPSGLSCVSIAYHGHPFDRAVSPEQSFQLSFGGLVGEVPYKDIRHSKSPWKL
jgi:hypothetical protein